MLRLDFFFFFLNPEAGNKYASLKQKKNLKKCFLQAIFFCFFINLRLYYNSTIARYVSVNPSRPPQIFFFCFIVFGVGKKIVNRIVKKIRNRGAFLCSVLKATPALPNLPRAINDFFPLQNFSCYFNN